MKKLLVLLMLVVGVIGCELDDDRPIEHILRFEVEGSDVVDIYYNNGRGIHIDKLSLELPFSAKSYSNREHSTAYLEVTRVESYNENITGSIYVDDVLSCTFTIDTVTDVGFCEATY